MYKLITVSGSDDSRLFSEIIRPGAPLVKEASVVHPDVQKCISGLKSTPGKIYILVNAMGAGEYYGSNFNGDFFEEKELNPPDGTSEYGYKTFLNSGVYRNHSNKDVTKSYGKVICSAYNLVMHRVELVIEIDEKKCKEVGHADLWDRLSSGEKPAVSMGCKVAYDVCSICGHKSATRQDYCEHARDQLSQVLPDGRKVFVYNPKPKFFDLSIVVIGADRASFVMDKVAHARFGIPSSAELAEDVNLTAASDILKSRMKLAAKGKSAEILKRVRATSARVVDPGEKEVDIPDETLDEMSESGDLGKILTTASSAGIVLKPSEFQRIVLNIVGKPSLARQYSDSGCCFCNSNDTDESVEFGDPSMFSHNIMSALMPMLQERSAFEPVVSRRIIIIKTARAKKPLRKIKTPLLDKVAAAYNGYRKQLLEKIGTIVANITERELNLLATVRGELLEDSLVRRNLGVKTASAAVPLALLGAIPLAYIYGAHSGSDEQEKAADSIIAKHPVLAMSVLAGLAKIADKELVQSGLLNKMLR
jgi:hypothetical protein